MAQEPIVIPIRVTGADKARRELESLGKKAKDSAAGVDKLGTALKGLASLEVARRVFGFGREFQNLERRLLSVSDSSEELAQNFALVQAVTRDTRSDLVANAAAFQKLSIAGDALGLTAQQTAQILKTLNQGFALGGASAQEQASSLLQLGQALGSGILAGEELRALRENAVVLAQGLARELGLKGVGELKKFAEQGKLTSDVVAQALLRLGDDVDTRFQKLPKTFDDSLNQMNSSLVRFGSAIVPVVQNVATSIENIAFSIETAAEAAERFALREDRKAALNKFKEEDAERGKRIQQLLAEAQAFRAQLDALRGDKTSDPAQRAQILVVLSGINRELQQVQDEATSAQERLDGVLASTDKRANRVAEANAARTNPFDYTVIPIAPTPKDAAPILGTDTQTKTIKQFSQVAIDELDRIDERSAFLEESLTSVFSTAADAWIEFLQTGEFAFDEFVSNIAGGLAEIAKNVLVNQLVGAILGGGTSALTPGSFGIAGFNPAQFRASGGPVEGGRPYVVGERRPELFVPSSSGRIEPSVPAGAQPIQLTVVNQIGEQEFVKVVDKRLGSAEGASATLTGLTKKKTQTKRMLSS